MPRLLFDPCHRHGLRVNPSSMPLACSLGEAALAGWWDAGRATGPGQILRTLRGGRACRWQVLWVNDRVYSFIF